MTRPREALISLEETPYYHITSRCVRQAFLCGKDSYSGKDYEHRRQWVVDRIRLLSSLFAIDVAAYAVLSNHYHLVLKVSLDQVDKLSDDAVIERWCALFKGPILIQHYRNGNDLKVFEKAAISDIVNVWRSRLSSISWFMRCLNQPIARQANLEDGCTGKFWGSRFNSQALKSEEALLSCMAYVDLNPVRAGIAETPESSSYTSIQERLTSVFDLPRAVKDQTEGGDLLDFKTSLKPLLSFEGREKNEFQSGLVFHFKDYLSLIEWTGRIIRSDKRGFIDQALPSILERLDITSAQWGINATQFEAVHPKRFNQTTPLLDTG